MPDAGGPTPPRVTRWFFKLLLRGDGEETIWGDVEEGFERRAALKGVSYARRWYRRQALGSVWALWTAPVRRHGSDHSRTGPRERRGDGFMMTVLQDIRYGGRGLRKAPGFAAVAILTLALGIGATTAIFSVVNGVLLQPLDYEDPDELVVIYTDLPEIGWFKTWFSGPELLDIRERTDVFSQVAAAFGGGAVTMTRDGEAEQIDANFVSWELFPLLGVNAARGRTFTEEEDLPDGPAVAMLSHEFWQRRFGADQGVLGRIVTINGVSREVVGVLPKGFSLDLPAATRKQGTGDIWIPGQTDYVAWGRHNHGLTPVARLAPGVTVGRARSEMEAFGTRLNEQHYQSTTGFALHVFALQPDLVEKARPALLALLGAVGFVLLIACANVANLLLARGATREREFALRTALGAGRGRIVRQILTESALLGMLGGIAGLALAFGGVRLLLGLSPEGLPRLDSVGVDGTTLVFTVGATLLTALLFGLAPALQVSGPGLHDALKQGGGGHSARRVRGRLSGGLVVGEMALSLVLLIGAGLMVRSFVGLYQVQPGFDPANLLTFQISLPNTAYAVDERAPYFDKLEERIAGLPGVTAVGAVSSLPLSNSSWSGPQTFLETTNGAPDNRDYFEVDQRVATIGYFDAMDIQLLAGRLLDSRDTRSAPPVAVIDETLAERVWPDENPIGKRFGSGANPAENNLVEVVGVVNHVRHHRLDSDGREQVYYSEAQFRFSGLSLVVRSTGDPLVLTGAIKAELKAVDPGVPAYDLRAMDDYVSSALSATRFNLILLGVFALLGLTLSSVGIYGVVAYTVSLRTQELGIRQALGAPRGHVLKLVLGQGAKLSLLGIVLGLGGAFALTRFMQRLLFNVAATDTLTYVGVATLLTGVSLLACYIPGKQASKVDPVIAMRDG